MGILLIDSCLDDSWGFLQALQFILQLVPRFSVLVKSMRHSSRVNFFWWVVSVGLMVLLLLGPGVFGFVFEFPVVFSLTTLF